MRRVAVEALGKIGDTRAVEPLIKALQDSEEYVRRGAVEALGKIGDTRAVEPLITVLRSWAYENVRQIAAYWLKELYFSGNLEEKHKQAIIALKGQSISHADYTPQHSDDHSDEVISWDASSSRHLDSGHSDHSDFQHTDCDQKFEV